MGVERWSVRGCREIVGGCRRGNLGVDGGREGNE